MGRLQDKVAIVTGATGGIGQEIVRVFVEEGARVVSVARVQENGEDEDAEGEGGDAPAGDDAS